MSTVCSVADSPAVRYSLSMPPNESGPEKSIEQIVEEVGLYPLEAFDFVQRGLQYTVQKLKKDPEGPAEKGRSWAAGA